MKRFLHLFIATSVALVISACSKSAPDSGTAEAHVHGTEARKYHCPMHPTYVSDKPGDCPICGMSLVPIEGQGGDPGQATPVTAGRVSIDLSGDRRQLIGLTLSKVETRDLSLTVRAPAVVQHDETRFARISPRFGGWIRKLQVAFVGAEVEKGQPLFTAYSPELYATENDYLIARRSLLQLKADAPAALRETAEALQKAARDRLLLWEWSDDDIRELETRDTPSQEFVFRSPLSGHVLTKNVVEGKAFMAGDTLFEVADLSRLWIQVSVAETDLSLLAVGQEASVSFPSLANTVFSAPIRFIDPHLDPQTRRGMARIELDNPGHALHPEMWAEVEIEIPLGKKLTVPVEAVIDTGKRSVAFVSRENGRLEPRIVKTGAKTAEFYEVKSGLAEGDQVVSRALFLVDSESQLQAAIAGMGESSEHKH